MRLKIFLMFPLIAVIYFSCLHRSESTKDNGENHGYLVKISQQPVLAGRVENELVTITFPVADYTDETFR